MLPYVIMMGVPAIIAVIASLEGISNDKKAKRVIDSFFLIFLCILICRDKTIGTDLRNYEILYREFSQSSISELLEKAIQGNVEIGFALLCKIVSLFEDNYQVVIIICAIIAVIPIWLLYRENVAHSYLAIVLFVTITCFALFFSGLRQAIAIGFIYPAYNCVKERKIVKFLLIVICAFLFHRSAAIMLLLYPIYYLRINKKWQIAGISLVLIISLIFNRNIFSFLIIFMGDTYIERYGSQIQSTGAYSVLILLILFLIYSYVIVDNKKISKDVSGLRNVLILCVILQIFAGIHFLAMRMNYYFIILVPILIGKLIDCTSESNRKIAEVSLIIMTVFFAAYYFYKAYYGNDILNIYPYATFWGA